MTTFSRAGISVGGDIQTVANINALRNHFPRTLRNGVSVIVSGQTEPGDGDEGVYIWAPGATDDDDGVSVIRPVSSIAPN